MRPSTILPQETLSKHLRRRRGPVAGHRTRGRVETDDLPRRTQLVVFYLFYSHFQEDMVKRGIYNLKWQKGVRRDQSCCTRTTATTTTTTTN
jgi:hypothetical protein